ncbi:hypothetical protein PMAYCL1PPCAC_30538, partial [Pristionchus mayeri]
VLSIPFILLMNQMSLISQRFPPDSDGTPLLVVMHYVAFVQVLLCFIGLVLLAHFYGARVGITINRKEAPSHYILNEATARLIYLVLTSLFTLVIAVGTLYFGSWNLWEPTDI